MCKTCLHIYFIAICPPCAENDMLLFLINTKYYPKVSYPKVIFRIFVPNYRIMTAYQSPFQFGTLATEDNFIDRVEDSALLKQLLLSHINVMLISPRRWGKSSLVKKTMDELTKEDAQVKVCYIDAFCIGSEAEFYRTFASQVIACASSKIERWIEDAKKFLTGVVPQIVVNDQVTDFVAFDLKFIPQERDKMTILQLPELLAKEKGFRIIVCIDEFQQLANLPEYKDMEGKMRSVWQQQQLTSYCLYGSKRNMMLHIFNNSNSPFYRFGQVIFMKKIAKQHWIPFIQSSFEKTGKSISYDFADRICEVVSCHSWYLQQLCYFIWSFTATEVTEDVFSLGLKQVLNINTPMFQNDTENLSSTQIEMLKAICQGEQHFSSQAVKQLYNLGNPNTIVKNKKTLQNKDMIEKAKDNFVFVDPIYRLWFNEEYC